MTEFFKEFIILISDIYMTLDEYGFEFFGFTLTIPQIMLSFVLISLVISFFWKGART